MLNDTHLSRVDLNLLVLFEAVLTERHVGRAAERLRLSPSAVSHGLGRLRKLLKDPLFLRTPKGVVPTERAMTLAAPVADILSRIRSVVSTAEPFEPRTSARRFTIGAPDGVSAVVLPQLLAVLRRKAPTIDISTRQILPPQGGTPFERAWQSALDDLESRSIDLAIVPLHDIPARFSSHVVYEEEFVVAARRSHPYVTSPGLKRFCDMRHVLVSLTGDPHGFVDEALDKRGLKRRIELTVPNFMMALVIIAGSDMIAALPRQLVATHAARFGVVGVKPPLPLRRDKIRAVVSRAALMDAGVAWIFGVLQELRLAK